MNKTRRQVREALVNLVYRHYVLKHDSLTSKQELLDNFQTNIEEIDIKNYEGIFDHLQEEETKISYLLKQGWELERLNNYEKAILIVGVYEIVYLGIDKKIIVNEMLNILEKYSPNRDYMYINRILDEIK